MVIAQNTDIETLILSLLREKPEVNLSAVAMAAGLPKDEKNRKAIRRVLNKLIEQGIIITKGKARARVYLRKESESEAIEVTALEKQEIFDGVKLSLEAKNLLNYLSKPTQARVPVGYNQDFLKSYEPNHTTYLSTAQRQELFTMGKVENTLRPAGTYARNILNRLLIDLSWNSSRLEGNTYSLLETKRLIEFGEIANDKDATETQMILNHKNAIEYIVDAVDETQISSLQICSLHALLSENLLGDPSACGRLRHLSVGISGSTYHPIDNPHLLRESLERFIQKLNLIKDPFEQSFFSIIHLSYLQAFEDVNKRTARLTANIPLIKQNLKPLSFIDVNKDAYTTALLGVYEKNDISLVRDLFMWAYQRSSQRYSAIQQALGKPELLKLKYRSLIHKIIQKIILEKVVGAQIIPKIKLYLEEQQLSKNESEELFLIIQTEIVSLHESNVARFKIRPSEFFEWKKLQMTNQS